MSEAIGAPAELVQFGLELVRRARAETLVRRLSNGKAVSKGRAAAYDPVTEADLEAERAMRSAIQERYPGHGIAGEELGNVAASERYSWSLDPIDGTRSYICGFPTWATLVALLDGTEPVLGIVDAPCLDETYVGTHEEAWLMSRAERTALRTSECRTLAEARLSTTDPFLFVDAEAEAFHAVRRRVRTTRYGHDGYAYARLAAGSIDLVIESGLKPHDYQALIPVVSSAGGIIGDWRGGRNFAAGRVLAAASQVVFEETVLLLERAA